MAHTGQRPHPWHNSLNYVWSVSLVDWVVETQPSGGGGATTIADGADVNAGATTDAAVVSDVNGTLSAKLRGLVKILADVWDSTNHFLTVSVGAYSTIKNGKKTVTTAGTRVTLASSTVVKSVTIKALVTNTGLIYVGDTAVANTNGYQLSAGDTVSLSIANLATVNLDSDVNGEGVTYVAVV